MTSVSRPLMILMLMPLFSLSFGAPVRKPEPPPPADRDYEVLWALASRTPTDPFGNSTGAGSCRRLLGPPKPESFKRKLCRADALMSWVPVLKAPRYVDIRFDPKPTILASRGLAVEIQLLYTGVLRPAIVAIEYMLTLPATPGLIPVPIYTADEANAEEEELNCPDFNVFPIPPWALLRPFGNTGASLQDALVLGVRITLNNADVEKKSLLPSISAVGLRVRPE